MNFIHLNAQSLKSSYIPPGNTAPHNGQTESLWKGRRGLGPGAEPINAQQGLDAKSITQTMGRGGRKTCVQATCLQLIQKNPFITQQCVVVVTTTIQILYHFSLSLRLLWLTIRWHGVPEVKQRPHIPSPFSPHQQWQGCLKGAELLAGWQRVAWLEPAGWNEGAWLCADWVWPRDEVSWRPLCLSECEKLEPPRRHKGSARLQTGTDAVTRQKIPL